MKNCTNKIFLLILIIGTVFIWSCNTSDPKNEEDVYVDTDVDIPVEGEVTDDPVEEACNYSSTDNRLKPKNEEVVFSGLYFGEKSLTKYTYVSNRCYTCDVSSPLIVTGMAIVNEQGAVDPGTFTIEKDPLENGSVSLQNDQEMGIGLSVVADTWEDQVRYLRIISNDKCKPQYDIKLISQTKSTGKIVIKTPMDDDPDDEVMVFGEVQEELVNELQAHNEGTANLKLLSVSISSGKSKSANETGFFLFEAPDPSVQITPGGYLPIKVGCRNDPEYPEPLVGELLILNNDPTNYGENQEKRIILQCGPDAQNAPEAKLTCTPEKVSVLSWSVLDGSDSVDSDGESKDELKYLWSFKTTPGGINLDIVDELNRAGSPINNDPMNTIAIAAFQAKVKGSYVVRLVVKNNKGVSSVPAECTVEAISDDDLILKLLWDNKNSDMDIHLISPDGTYGDSLTDCYYWNCSPQYSGERPDWGVEGETKDDPYLDIDNVTGMGPETLYVNKPAVGTYKVTVHAYDTSGGPTTAVVKAYVHAEEDSAQELLMTRTDTCWDVYTIEVSEGDGTQMNVVVKPITPAEAYDCERPQQ